MCSNSFSHSKVDQKKTVAISQIFNHVQLYVHWMHLLNTRIYRYTYVTPTVIYYDQDRCVMNLFNFEQNRTELYFSQIAIQATYEVIHTKPNIIDINYKVHTQLNRGLNFFEYFRDKRTKPFK